MLDIKCERKKHIAEVSVQRGKRLQIPEVEIDVLPIARATYPLLEEYTVCRNLEEIGPVREIGCSLFLRTETEGHALALQMIDLLIDAEHWLGWMMLATCWCANFDALFLHDGSFRRGHIIRSKPI